jgi:hypothetical protein
MRRVVAAALLTSLLVAPGCSGDRAAKPDAASDGARSQAAVPPGIDPASRVDLDGGRVSVFSPQGWRRAPRSYDYLVRYQSTPQLPYPAVVVLAADPPAGITEVTDASHMAFVEALGVAVGEAEGKGLLRKPARAKLGPHHAATWSAAGEAKLDGPMKPIERECTAVVVDGRLYTVEAWAPRGKLTDTGREAARAVAAALAVPSLDPVESLVPAEPAAAEAAEAPPEVEPKADEPGATEPAASPD